MTPVVGKTRPAITSVIVAPSAISVEPASHTSVSFSAEISQVGVQVAVPGVAEVTLRATLEDTVNRGRANVMDSASLNTELRTKLAVIDVSCPTTAGENESEDVEKKPTVGKDMMGVENSNTFVEVDWCTDVEAFAPHSTRRALAALMPVALMARPLREKVKGIE